MIWSPDFTKNRQQRGQRGQREIDIINKHHLAAFYSLAKKCGHSQISLSKPKNAQKFTWGWG